MQELILDLLEKDQVVLIRGTHEDLALNLLHNWHRYSYLQSHHHTNGTIKGRTISITPFVVSALKKVKYKQLENRLRYGVM